MSKSWAAANDPKLKKKKPLDGQSYSQVRSGLYLIASTVQNVTHGQSAATQCIPAALVFVRKVERENNGRGADLLTNNVYW